MSAQDTLVMEAEYSLEEGLVGANTEEQVLLPGVDNSTATTATTTTPAGRRGNGERELRQVHTPSRPPRRTIVVHTEDPPETGEGERLEEGDDSEDLVLYLQTFPRPPFTEYLRPNQFIGQVVTPHAEFLLFRPMFLWVFVCRMYNQTVMICEAVVLVALAILGGNTWHSQCDVPLHAFVLTITVVIFVSIQFRILFEVKVAAAIVYGRLPDWNPLVPLGDAFGIGVGTPKAGVCAYRFTVAVRLVGIIMGCLGTAWVTETEKCSQTAPTLYKLSVSLVVLFHLLMLSYLSTLAILYIVPSLRRLIQAQDPWELLGQRLLLQHGVEHPEVITPHMWDGSIAAIPAAWVRRSDGGPVFPPGASGQTPVAPEIIDSLPVQRWGDIKRQRRQDDSENTATCDDSSSSSSSSGRGVCSICIERYVPEDEVITLPCSHQYHRQCIVDWFAVGATCPSCRAPINPTPNSVPTHDAVDAPIHPGIQA